MLLESKQSALVFFSYAYQDKKLRDELSKHLSILKYRGLIKTWYDQNILAGEARDQQVDIHLEKAHIILLLISAHFLASDYCFGIQMKRALERLEKGEADVIPILLRPVYYKQAPFAKLRMLPTNGKPITKWHDQDDAFVNIALNIEKVAQKYVQPTPTRSLMLTKYGNWFPSIGWVGCLGWLIALILLGSLLSALRPINTNCCTSPPPPDYTAIIPFASIIVLLASINMVKDIQSNWKKFRKRTYYEEAFIAYQRALDYDPLDVNANLGMGNTLFALRRYDEALNAFIQAINRSPIPSAYSGLGSVYTKLKRHNEAVEAYERAIALDPTVTFDLKSFRQSLQAIGRKQDAKQILQKNT